MDRKEDGIIMDNKKCTVELIYNGQRRQMECLKGSNLMELLQKNKVYIEAPCGGKGICGKCKIKIESGILSELTSEEKNFLSDKEKKEGYRLACCTQVMGDVVARLDDSADTAQIVSKGLDYSTELNPSLCKKYLAMEPPSVEDQRDDLKRLEDKLNIEKISIPLKLLQKLPSILRDSGYKVTAVYDGNTMLALEPGDTTERQYGIAVDIGTTTVVCYLVDLTNGEQLDVASRLNAQKSYGGDVISRIAYVAENADGLERLQKEIADQLEDMIKGLAQKNGIEIEYIYNIVIAANTTMLHLLAGLSPEHIAAAPFTPVATEQMVYSASQLGIDINPACRIFMLPSISGYVGADIVAGILPTGLDQRDELSLMIDIGTNGEIVLGNNKGLISCSTAAGPAFEGANIRNGVGGIAGAINTVRLEDGDIQYTTISNAPPIGICGSGIVDALAVLLDAGIVDETGRILLPDELDLEAGSKLSERLIEIDDMPAFVIAKEEESRSGEPIVITQKDVREIQLAKAAIAAGTRVLINKMGVTMKEIDCLYLAGGFGSYIDKRNAVRIGLLPKELENKIVAVGNAAGTGALLALQSRELLSRCNDIKAMVKYVELSATPEFQEEYISCMYFE